MARTAILILSLLLIPVATLAATVELNSSTKKYDLGLNIEYYEDKEGDISIQELASSDTRRPWEKNTIPTPNLAFSESVFWFRLNFRSTLAIDKAWYFELAFPLQDYIDFYVVDDQEVVKAVKTGDRLPYNTREIDYRNFLFLMDIPAGEERQVYIRLDTADGLHEPTPLILWDKLEFTIQHGLRNLGLGLYFGIMVVMALYNLFVYASIRDKAYIYYVAYIFGFSAWLFTYYGFSYQYFWPNSPTFGNLSTIFLTALWNIFMALFVGYFLDVKNQMPWFYKIIKVYIACLIFTMLSSFYGNYSFGIICVIGFGIPAAFIGIAAGVQSWRMGYKPARFFLLAWLVLLFSLIIFSLKISGLLPSIWIIERSVQIGSAIEVILFSLGLADRINMLEKERLAAQKEALESFESSIRLKNDFITSISHELRTPMNAILGGVEATRGLKLGQLKEPVSIIHSGANDMMRLVDDILIHTELQSGQLNLKTESAEVKTAIGRLNQYYTVACEEKGLTFHYKLDPGIPAWIIVDSHKLAVILTKLINNAIKFTDKGSVKLTVSLDGEGDSTHLVCTVSDTGPGIPPESQSLIFDPFVQVEGGFTRRHGGMGIGLSICRRLAEIMGGTLTLESEMGVGSRFTLRFPVRAGEPIVNAADDILASPSRPVLLVEDNVVNQKVTVKMLEKLGLSGIVANHGKEALEYLEKENFSLVLMDLQMPVMDGFQCTKAIRESSHHYSDIPIIAVTANVMEQDKERCLETGMNVFLEKPLKLEVLQRYLSRYISLEKTRAALLQ